MAKTSVSISYDLELYIMRRMQHIRVDAFRHRLLQNLLQKTKQYNSAVLNIGAFFYEVKKKLRSCHVSCHGNASKAKESYVYEASST